MDSGPPDEELVRRFLRGDDDAFAALVRRHEARVYNLAFRLLGNPDDAREAAQEAFVTCVRKLRSFRGDSAFGTWLYRVASNAAYDVLRRRRRTPVPVEELPEPDASPDMADAGAVAVDVQRALERVPREFRLVLVLHDVEGLPYEEIATIVGVPVGTVKSRIHRGRVALGRALGGEHAGGTGASNAREER